MPDFAVSNAKCQDQLSNILSRIETNDPLLQDISTKTIAIKTYLILEYMVFNFDY